MKRPSFHPLRPCPALLLLVLTAGPVRAQAPPPEEDIRGPRPTVVIPVPPKTPTVLYAGIAALALLAGAAALLLRRRHVAALRLTPLEKAREGLHRLNGQRETLTAGDLAEETARVVRQFIAGSFGLAAPQRTTEEFLRALTADPASPLQAHAGLLGEFLTTCDKAKFAAADFDPVERFALLETAGRFIQSAARSAAVPPVPPA